MPTEDTRPDDSVVDDAQPDDAGADDAVQDYLATLTGRCRTLLGAGLVGVYAGGSLALHGFRPGRSDIDVAVVSADALTDPQKQALVERLRQESLPCPARGLELVAYRAAVAAAGGPAPGLRGRAEHRPPGWPSAPPPTRPGDRRPDELFWYAIDRSILAAPRPRAQRAAGRCGLGSPPGRSARQLLIESLRWHLASDTPVADDAVLNACRALHRVRSGRWLAKPAAGRAIPGRPRPAGPATLERACSRRRTRTARREGGRCRTRRPPGGSSWRSWTSCGGGRR